jgi:uroporphyrinogen-III decarboxylase
MLAAIRGEPVDRLPVATYNCHPFSWGEHRKWPQYRPILDAVRRTGAGMLCKAYATGTGGVPEPSWSEVTRDGHRICTAVLETPAGPLRKVIDQPPDQPGRTMEHYIKSDEDIERVMSLRPAPITWDVDGVADRCREVGESGLVYLAYKDPFGWSASMFDEEDLLLRIATDPEPVMALIEWAAAYLRGVLASLLAALAATQVEVLFYTGGPELATPPMMGPDAFGRVVTPYETELASMIHEAGFPVSVHCHGRVRAALPEVIKCGFDVLEPIEPPDQGDISLPELREAAGEKLCLLGYVQDQELYTRTAEHIRGHVGSIVETISGGTRYIAAPTCTPFAFPPPERYVTNYVAFLEAAGELGA